MSMENIKSKTNLLLFLLNKWFVNKKVFEFWKHVIEKISENERKEILEKIKKIREWQKYVSTEGYEYTGYNEVFLKMICKPWVFWTFKQWLEKGRIVSRWSQGIPLNKPLIKKEEDWSETIFWMKSFYVFPESYTKEIET